MGSFGFLLRDLLFPPRCVGCGTRRDPIQRGAGSSPLCDACALKWEKSMRVQCPDCFAAYHECRCMPEMLKRAGAVSLVKLAPYGGAKGYETVDQVIHSIKRYPRSRAFDFCVEQLCDPLKKEVAKCQQKAAVSHTVIAHLPRQRKRVRALGFDQSQELAKRLSARLGYPAEALLRRVRDGKAQKELTAAARRQNIKGSFRCTRDLTGSRVILLDDVVTTGAGMAEATRLLRAAGAAQVICVCVAQTPKKAR